MLTARLSRGMPSLASAAAAIGLASMAVKSGWVDVAVTGGVVFVFVLACWRVGLGLLPRRPYAAAYLLEVGIGLEFVTASVLGAVLIWFGVDVAPGDTASDLHNEMYAAGAAALAVFLGSVGIDPEGGRWNPVRSGVTAEFRGRFTARSTPVEKDADDAVRKDEYGAQAPEHHGDRVSGWDWGARRLRTRHIGDAL